jgi:hypothetical protein
MTYDELRQVLGEGHVVGESVSDGRKTQQVVFETERQQITVSLTDGKLTRYRVAGRAGRE